ncbi:MAG: hypothetical protein M1816_007553 [Peltula sp. TS41687]|nr:MAG: hypothetical protein M1816_007553 [Peltula sp. TS41687]
MAPTITQPHLSNALATAAQLSSPSGSQLDGVPSELETSVRYAGARLTQNAGILLRLPQDIIARAIVIFTRFWVGPEGGSMRHHDAELVSAASLYLTAKLSSHPQTPRNVLNVYAFLIAQLHSANTPLPGPESAYVSEGSYFTRRAELLKTETAILRVLGLDTHVALPYALAVNYLQALDVFDAGAAGAGAGAGAGQDVARRVFAHLTAALLSPQLLYLTHQPPALATAAIYLAAREVGVALPAEEWWIVFDVEREELGFLVVAMGSMAGFAERERERWMDGLVPLRVGGVERVVDGG